MPRATSKIGTATDSSISNAGDIGEISDVRRTSDIGEFSDVRRTSDIGEIIDVRSAGDIGDGHIRVADIDDAVREIWFDHGGTRLFAVESGDGPPIVLLHGGLANHLACRVFAAPLASRFRLITPDLRGSGRSRYAGALSWDQLADDVAALVRHLGLARAVIGGISFGAGVAVRVALRHPAVTAALVVLTPAFAGADVGLTAAQQSAMQAMDAAGSRAVAEGVQVLHPLFDALPAPIRERARAVVETYDAASVAASTRFMASGAQPFATAAALAAITAPTLLIPGSDPYHPVEVADVYRRHLARCTVRAAAPADYAAAIADFVERAGI